MIRDPNLSKNKTIHKAEPQVQRKFGGKMNPNQVQMVKDKHFIEGWKLDERDGKLIFMSPDREYYRMYDISTGTVVMIAADHAKTTEGIYEVP